MSTKLLHILECLYLHTHTWPFIAAWTEAATQNVLFQINIFFYIFVFYLEICGTFPRLAWSIFLNCFLVSTFIQYLIDIFLIWCNILTYWYFENEFVHFNTCYLFSQIQIKNKQHLDALCLWYSHQLIVYQDIRNLWYHLMSKTTINFPLFVMICKGLL